MGNPFLGSIRIFAFNFAPEGWAPCNGQLMSVAQHTALFSLLGTRYGGDGKTTFALPDLQCRVPIHAGQGAGLSSYDVGSKGGATTVTLSEAEMPAHLHEVRSTSAVGNNENPTNAVWAPIADVAVYANTGSLAPMHPESLKPSGSSRPHDNIMPGLGLGFYICLHGRYPFRP